MIVRDLFVTLYTTSLYVIVSGISFNFEKSNKFGSGRRSIPSVFQSMGNGYAYPQPLPTSKQPFALDVSEKIYQGARRIGDISVFHKKFDYPARAEGHMVTFRNSFPCVVSFLSVESEEGIPILFRGGVGHNYILVIVKAKAGVRLLGKIQAFCRKGSIIRNDPPPSGSATKKQNNINQSDQVNENSDQINANSDQINENSDQMNENPEPVSNADESSAE